MAVRLYRARVAAWVAIFVVFGWCTVDRGVESAVTSAVGSNTTLTPAAAAKLGVQALFTHVATTTGNTTAVAVLQVWVAHNGTDGAGCGANETAPCRSLLFVAATVGHRCSATAAVIVLLAATPAPYVARRRKVWWRGFMPACGDRTHVAVACPRRTGPDAIPPAHTRSCPPRYTPPRLSVATPAGFGHRGCAVALVGPAIAAQASALHGMLDGVLMWLPPSAPLSPRAALQCPPPPINGSGSTHEVAPGAMLLFTRLHVLGPCGTHGGGGGQLVGAAGTVAWESCVVGNMSRVDAASVLIGAFAVAPAHARPGLASLGHSPVCARQCTLVALAQASGLCTSRVLAAPWSATAVC